MAQYMDCSDIHRGIGRKDLKYDLFLMKFITYPLFITGILLITVDKSVSTVDKGQKRHQKCPLCTVSTRLSTVYVCYQHRQMKPLGILIPTIPILYLIKKRRNMLL